ncbi:MAG TPA: DUF1559 domain-containing protein, partial [Gemmatales bacterium]|nr:DUF1559 domain-containing protein [Gemmatales bacterium]
IIALLLALLLPAIQRVREAANQLMCKNNLKQLALAVQHFHHDFGSFPPARITYKPDEIPLLQFDAELELPTWKVRILPYLERDSDYAQWQLTSPFGYHSEEVRNRVVSTYLCPSRRGVGQAVVPPMNSPDLVLPCGCIFEGRQVPGGAASDYAGNHGDLSPGSSGLATDFYWGGQGTGVIISSRPVNFGRSEAWFDKIRMADIRDGTSHTVVIGEMHIPKDKLSVIPDNGPAYDGSRFYQSTRVGGLGVPIANGPDDDVFGLSLFAFGSWHPGVCQFAFVDGHVIPIRNSISTETLARLCHRRDGLDIPPLD